MNTANMRQSYIFVAPANDDMTGFAVYSYNKFGTVTNIARADLYAADSDGNPTGSSLANATYTPAASGVNQEVTWGAAYTVTAGSAYCVVLKNTDGTPGTNYWQAGITDTSITGGSSDRFQKSSTDAGSTWSNTSPSGHGCIHFVPKYSSTGYYAVGPVMPQGSGSSSFFEIYNDTGSRVSYYGLKIVPSVNYLLTGADVAGLTVFTGAAYNLKVVVLESGSVVATSSIFLGPNGTCHFTTPYVLLSGHTYYICVTPDGADDGTSGVFYYTGGILTGTCIEGSGDFKGYFKSTATTPSWTVAFSLHNGAYVRPHLHMAKSAGGSTNVGSRIGPGSLIRN